MQFDMDTSASLYLAFDASSASASAAAAAAAAVFCALAPVAATGCCGGKAEQINNNNDSAMSGLTASFCEQFSTPPSSPIPEQTDTETETDENVNLGNQSLLFSTKNKPVTHKKTAVIKSALKKRNQTADGFTTTFNTTTANTTITTKRVRWTEDTKESNKPSLMPTRTRRRITLASVENEQPQPLPELIPVPVVSSPPSHCGASLELDLPTRQILNIVVLHMGAAETLEQFLHRLDMSEAFSATAQCVREVADNLLFQGELWIYQMTKSSLSRLL